MTDAAKRMDLAEQASAVEPAGESKRTYFAVIALVGLALVPLSSLVTWGLLTHLIRYTSSDFNLIPAMEEAIDVTVSLAFVCLFFAALYLYGRRTAEYFRESCKTLVLLLFVSCALGFPLYLLAVPLFGGGFGPLTAAWWIELALEMAQVGLTHALIGIGALAVAYLTVETPTPSGPGETSPPQVSA
jgi:hypothetical protein